MAEAWLSRSTAHGDLGSRTSARRVKSAYRRGCASSWVHLGVLDVARIRGFCAQYIAVVQVRHLDGVVGRKVTPDCVPWKCRNTVHNTEPSIERVSRQQRQQRSGLECLPPSARTAFLIMTRVCSPVTAPCRGRLRGVGDQMYSGRGNLILEACRPPRISFGSGRDGIVLPADAPTPRSRC